MASPPLPIISIAVAGLVIAYALSRISSFLLGGYHASLPPGPKGYPLVGNINDLPKPGEFEAHHWLKHKELYGPLSSVTVMGQTIVIINNIKLAVEMLEKRSVKYSSRPRQVFAGEMVGWENAVGLCQYNNRFRASRKAMSRVLGSKRGAAQFDKLQEAEVGHFLLHILGSPGELFSHIKKEAGSVILRIVYGYITEPHKDDPLVDMASEAMENFARAAVPGAFLVDIISPLRYLPDWLPGTQFKQIARKWREQLEETTEKPYAFVKHQMAQGRYETSFISRLLETGDSGPEEKHTNKWAALALYTAGADTTVAAISCFFLVMTAYPEVQRRAQEEIDRVVGQDRLPATADREHLPYVNAIVKEVLRWNPVAPMGLPHASTEDDICGGWFIPKGSMILPNVWYFAHDPSVYRDPETFDPERFLAKDGHEPEQDPHSYVFGFGRRICPGRILADNALYLNIAQSLAVFNINKPQINGQEVEPVMEFQPGVISHPTPFKTQIQPRSPHHEKLIKSIEKTHPWLESGGEVLQSMDYKA